MRSRFFIELTCKSPNGPEVIARFFAGNSRISSAAVFGKLKGSGEVDEKNVIFLNFVETRNDLPVNLDIITCTLDELGENCKIITKELFKLHSLLPEA